MRKKFNVVHYKSSVMVTNNDNWKYSLNLDLLILNSGNYMNKYYSELVICEGVVDSYRQYLIIRIWIHSFRSYIIL